MILSRLPFAFFLLFAWTWAGVLPITGQATLAAIQTDWTAQGGKDAAVLSCWNTISFVGMLLGFVVFGFLADIYGRFRVLLWLLLFGSSLLILCATLSVVTQSPLSLASIQFFVSMASGGIFLTGTLLTFENRSSQDRLFFTALLPLSLFFAVLSNNALESALLPDPKHWRMLLFIKGVPGIVAQFFYLWHDESRAWKRTVRDTAGSKPFLRPWHRLKNFLGNKAARLKTRLAFAATLVCSVILFSVFLNLLYWSEKTLTYHAHMLTFSSDDQREDAILLATIFRYPSLIDAEKFQSPSKFLAMKDQFLVWPAIAAKDEFLFSPTVATLETSAMPEFSDLPPLLFEAMCQLRAIPQDDKENFTYRAISDVILTDWNARWNEQNQARRAISEIPLWRVENMQERVQRYFEKAEKTLAEDSRFTENAALSGAERWQLRKKRFADMIESLNSRFKSRRDQEFSLIRSWSSFLWGGALLGYLAFNFCIAILRKNGTWTLFFLFILALWVPRLWWSGDGIPPFRFVLLLFVQGIFICPLLAFPIIQLPRFFPTSCRGLSLGLAFFVVGCAAGLGALR